MNEPFIYHKPVSGAAFAGRSAEARGLANMLSSGENVVIYEPPKSGKHSLMMQATFIANQKGTPFCTAEVDMSAIRSSKDFACALGSAAVNACCTGPGECAEAVRTLLDGTKLVFDPVQYSAGGASVSASWDLGEEDFTALLSLPYRLSEMKGRRIVVILDEFQNIMHFDDADMMLRLAERVLKDEASGGRPASYLFSGSKVNAMHEIFGTHRRFFRLVERIRLTEISEADIVSHVNRGFNASGKVMEKDILLGACRLFRNNIFYVNLLCSICDSLTRGYVVEATVKDALARMLAIYGPRYHAIMDDLTGFQARLLRAVLEGHSKFTGADVIEDYGLNSSANVKRLRDALCKKEVISFDDDGRPYVIDPLFEYWVRTYYFKLQ